MIEYIFVFWVFFGAMFFVGVYLERECERNIKSPILSLPPRKRYALVLIGGPIIWIGIPTFLVVRTAGLYFIED